MNDSTDVEDPTFDVYDDEDPIEDGPLQGEFVKLNGTEGVAWYVDADDGVDLVRIHMVGDDRRFTFPRSEVSVLAREAFCGSCGQIGCTHDGLER